MGYLEIKRALQQTPAGTVSLRQYHNLHKLLSKLRERKERQINRMNRPILTEGCTYTVRRARPARHNGVRYKLVHLREQRAVVESLDDQKRYTIPIHCLSVSSAEMPF